MSRTQKGSKPLGWDYWGKRKVTLLDRCPRLVASDTMPSFSFVII